MTDRAGAETSRGDVFLDARGHGRAMRLSWHPEADIVVLSLWREETCAGTFRMPHEDVAAFVDALIDGLRDAPGVHLPPPVSAEPEPQPEPQLDDSTGAASGPAALGATQAMPAPEPRPAFLDLAFGSSEPGGHANAS